MQPEPQTGHGGCSGEGWREGPPGPSQPEEGIWSKGAGPERGRHHLLLPCWPSTAFSHPCDTPAYYPHPDPFFQASCQILDLGLPHRLWKDLSFLDCELRWSGARPWPGSSVRIPFCRRPWVCLHSKGQKLSSGALSWLLASP